MMSTIKEAGSQEELEHEAAKVLRGDLKQAESEKEDDERVQPPNDPVFILSEVENQFSS